MNFVQPYINSAVTAATAAAGGLAGGVVDGVGNGISTAGRTVGDSIAGAAQGWGTGICEYGNSIKDYTKATGPRSQTAGNPLGLQREGNRLEKPSFNRPSKPKVEKPKAIMPAKPTPKAIMPAGGAPKVQMPAVGAPKVNVPSAVPKPSMPAMPKKEMGKLTNATGNLPGGKAITGKGPTPSPATAKKEPTRLPNSTPSTLNGLPGAKAAGGVTNRANVSGLKNQGSKAMNATKGAAGKGASGGGNLVSNPLGLTAFK